MAGLFSDRYHWFHGRFKFLYLVAGDFCDVGSSLLHLRRCPFAVRSVSNQDDLGLFSTGEKEAWDLRSISPT